MRLYGYIRNLDDKNRMVAIAILRHEDNEIKKIPDKHSS